MTFNEILLLLIGGGAFLFMMYMFIRAIFQPNPVDPTYHKKSESKEKPALKGKAKA
jgi:hypothetical protein